MHSRMHMCSLAGEQPDPKRRKHHGVQMMVKSFLDMVMKGEEGVHACMAVLERMCESSLN